MVEQCWPSLLYNRMAFLLGPVLSSLSLGIGIVPAGPGDSEMAINKLADLPDTLLLFLGRSRIF